MEILEITTVLVILGLMLTLSTAFVKATNESSYQYGYEQGSLKSPQIAPGVNWNPEFDNNTCALRGSYILDNPKGAVIPAITDTTSCIHGWYECWKNWCNKHAVDCVQNITNLEIPRIILQAHEQYLTRARPGNDSVNSMCPIGENTAFCQGWDYNNDCSDSPLANITRFLIGCPDDIMTKSVVFQR